MNCVNLIGRITRDPDVRYGQQSNKAIARFSIAIDRGKDKDGKDRGADFPNIICFDKVAELAEKYLKKGLLVGVNGHIQTGSYDRDGQKVYTTDVVADRLDFIEWRDQNAVEPDIPTGFSRLEDDIPF